MQQMFDTTPKLCWIESNTKITDIHADGILMRTSNLSLTLALIWGNYNFHMFNYTITYNNNITLIKDTARCLIVTQDRMQFFLEVS